MTNDIKTQIEQFQYLIHYAPERQKEYLRQIQQQEYLKPPTPEGKGV